MSRANGRAWGENREHYSNQLGGQVIHDGDGNGDGDYDDDTVDDYDDDDEGDDANDDSNEGNNVLTFSNISGCGEAGGGCCYSNSHFFIVILMIVVMIVMLIMILMMIIIFMMIMILMTRLADEARSLRTCNRSSITKPGKPFGEGEQC